VKYKTPAHTCLGNGGRFVQPGTPTAVLGIPRLATSHCFEALAAQTVRMLEDNLELCNAIDTVSLKSYQKAAVPFGAGALAAFGSPWD